MLLRAAEAAPAQASPPETVAAAPSLRIVTYNLCNYRDRSQPQIRTPEAREAVLRELAELAPDIAVLVETSGEGAVADIRDELARRGQPYPFQTTVPGADVERRIGILARQTPAALEHVTDSTYRLRDRDVPVQRGFGHCLFAWPSGYRLHLVAAHLKSKAFDPLGQTDMRRYEARLLRYLVDDIIGREADANILLVGDLNDTPDSSPISTLCSRRSNPPKQLYDLRPLDRFGMSWTHYWGAADTYSRIDYAMASFGLLPEVDFALTEIPFPPDWAVASDHRPLLITLRLGERPPSPDCLARFERNARLPESPAGDVHDQGAASPRSPVPGQAAAAPGQATPARP